MDAAGLSRLAGRTGFPEATLDRVLRLHALVQDIAVHPLLREALALKGGTALNLFFGEPARLSVVLDFNYVGSPERSVMERDRPIVEKAVCEIGRAQGYRVQLSAEAHAGRKIYFDSQEGGTPARRVEVDLNYLHRVPLYALEARSMWHPDGAASRALPLMSLEEICAGKVCAMLDRGLPRDLFDVVRLSERASELWTGPRFRIAFLALAGALPKPLNAYEGPLRSGAMEAAVQQQLWPMLVPAARTSAAVLLEAAQRAVTPLLRLTPAEQEFHDRLHAGVLAPALLAPDDEELAGRISRHPVLRWKAQNAREFAARRPRKGA